MKYQKSIKLTVDLKQIPLSALLLEREDVNDAFDNTIEYLKSKDIDIPKTIKNALFFKKLNPQSGKTSSKFQRTKERMLGSCFHLNSPEEIFELLITSAVLSCRFKNTMVELILGNPQQFQVEMTFDEGKILSYNSYMVVDNEFIYFNDNSLLKSNRNIFQCTEGEMMEYFEPGVLERLVPSK